MTLACTMASASPQVIKSLARAVEDTPFTHTPAYVLIGVGAMVCKLAGKGLSYYHLVVTDQATPSCEKGVDQAFKKEGLPRWRDCVIEILRMPRPNRRFPGSKESTLYVIHPEVTR
ncbi:hypothetical protein [Streptomyces sp. UNOB3_S3]|uniref:hypothetical protein n=1 Tax=Streptomyces sp. UNOB3_S3 TaxID=2871682 RepID=UPI001E3961D1|nr:hypothetical protein [Streptomyces sp. UNOB3_S3]MCC3775179.1 hypothetical protein [Streptomyces sp. UNOB3_S3]